MAGAGGTDDGSSTLAVPGAEFEGFACVRRSFILSRSFRRVSERVSLEVAVNCCAASGLAERLGDGAAWRLAVDGKGIDGLSGEVLAGLIALGPVGVDTGGGWMLSFDPEEMSRGRSKVSGDGRAPEDDGTAALAAEVEARDREGG